MFSTNSQGLFIPKLLPWLTFLSVTMLLLAWGWGLGFAPSDVRQSDGFRIIYFHVPAAWGSLLIYLGMACCAFIALVWRNGLAEQLLVAMIPVGALYTAIALLTGSIWGAIMWGSWWEWDARMTSELILFFLYLGALGLYHSLDASRQAAKLVAILVLVGVINIPLIHYSVEWWNTLHQPSTRFQQTLAPAMRTPLRLAMLGYTLFFVNITLIRLNTAILIMKKQLYIACK